MMATYHPLVPWLAFVIVSGLILMFNRYRVLLFVLATVATLPLCFYPLSWPSGKLPKQEYNVLGYRIDYKQAIYVLLDMDKPRNFVLPYTDEQAEQLQRAMNGQGAVMGYSDGELVFEETPGKDEGK